MPLALAEIRRARGRFTTIVVALALLVVLVLVLTALADGLFYGSSGAVRTVRGDLQVLSADAEGALRSSRLPPELGDQLARVDGVAAVGPVAVFEAGGRRAGGGEAGGRGSGAEVDLAVFGIEPGRPGEPAQLVEGRLPAAGEAGVAAVDTSLAEDGIGLGGTVTVAGSDEPLQVVGVVGDASYGLQGTVWTPLPTFRALRAAALPETAGGPDTFAAYAVDVEEGRDPRAVAAAIDAAADTTTVPRSEAASSDPLLVTQNAVLRAVVGATLVVAGLVVALFFALLTLEKRGLFAVVKALGARTGYLATGVVAQAVIASLAGLALGGLLTALLALVIPEAVPTRFRPQSVATVVALTLPTGVLGAALSFRRIARIDPAAALGGTV